MIRHFPRHVALILLCVLAAGCVVQPVQPVPSATPAAVESAGGAEAGVEAEGVEAEVDEAEDSAAAEESAEAEDVETEDNTDTQRSITGSAPSRFCELSADGTGYTSRGGTFVSADESAATGLPRDYLHGGLVYSVIHDTLSEVGATPISSEEVSSEHEELTAILLIDEFSRPAMDYFAEEIAIAEAAGTEPSEVEVPAPKTQPVYYEWWRVPTPAGNERAFIVAVVDIQEFDLNQTADAMASAIATLRIDHQVQNFVLNMSWMILPCGDIPDNAREFMETVCNVLSWDEIATLTAIETLVNFLGHPGSGHDVCPMALNGDIPDDVPAEIAAPLFNTPQLARAWVYQRLQEAEQPDETILDLFLGCLVEPVVAGGFCQELVDLEIITIAEDGSERMEQQFIPVAAAGNLPLGQALGYPFLPALWDAVVSVSANDSMIGNANDYTSNPGEVAIIGQGPLLADTLDERHVGTSFAAPRLSVWAALYLLFGGETPCPSYSDRYPALGYKESWDEFYADLTLRDTAYEFCPEFESVLSGEGLWDLVQMTTEP